MQRPGSPIKKPSLRSILSRTGVMVLCLLGASLIGYAFHLIGLPGTDIAIVYLLSVLLTARFTDGYFFGVLSSLLAAFLFNFFFMEPYNAFSVNTQNYIITFIIMIITALITSTLTTHAKKNAISARQREAETKALYTLTNRLTDASDLQDIARTATRAISHMLDSRVGFLCFDENGEPPHCEAAAEGGGEEPFLDWPIQGGESVLGILRIPKAASDAMDGTQSRMLHAMLESTALAMDRFRAAQQRRRTDEAIVQERYRGNLLRAISHDLRTPLAGMMGTAEMLLSMTDKSDRRYALLEGVCRDADWLHSLVENILSLTRLQDGKLVLRKQEEAVEEVVGAAVLHISRLHPEHEISVTVPDELLLIPMDAKLIRQVLINLLDNAAKHTPPEGEIHVSVSEDRDGGYAEFSVRDSGGGIAAADIPNIFEMFYTSAARQSDSQLGVGLGLTICDAIVTAHGGRITARNRPDGPGAEFLFTLPLEGHRS